MKKIIAITLTLFVFALVGIGLSLPSADTITKNPMNPVSPTPAFPHQTVRVKGEDKTCETDTECVIVPTECGFCECGEAINRKHEQTYTDMFNGLCTGYSGPVCDYACSTPRARCVENSCVLTLPDAVTTSFVYKVREISEKKLKPGLYNIEGYVYGISECVPCPPGAVCEVCLKEHIAISDDAAPTVLTGSKITEKEMILIVPDPSKKFERGKKYIFSVQIGVPYDFTGRYIDSYNTNFSIVGYTPVP